MQWAGLLLYVLLGADLPAAAGVQPPRGIYVSAGPTTDRSDSVKTAYARRDYPDGVFVRIAWKELEPRPGEFHWERLDEQFRRAGQYGFKISLAVMSGPGAPAWLEGGGAAMVDLGIRGARMPLPWDPVCQEHWGRFVEALGGQYDGNSTLSLVYMTAPTYNGLEMQLGFGPDSEREWERAGYSDEKYIAAWKHAIDAFGKAFAVTPLDVDVHPVNRSSVVAEQVAAYGRQQLGRRLGVFACWWTEKNTKSYASEYRLLQQAVAGGFGTVELAYKATGQDESANFGAGVVRLA